MKHKSLNHYSQKLFILALISLLVISCKKDKTSPENKYLVKSSWIADVTSTQILTISSTYSDVYNMLLSKELSDIKIYKLVYKTKNVTGEEIQASGALIIPNTKKILPLLSYQHGSLFTYGDAPSKYFTGGETRLTASILASAGYVVSVPDYIGYGESESYPHPYEHAKSLASASFDMLMAAKEYLKNNNISMSDKLFITGYSEGGNATMALQRYIEENSDLVVTMSAPGSGAYNKTAFAKDILQRNENLNFLPRFMWVINTYNWVYGINRAWNQYVNEPYATTLTAVSNPFNFGDANISLNPNDLFTTSLKDGVLNNTDMAFLNALADNDNFNWKPKYPITLYYGTADDYVFPLNSETAYDAIHANGADITKVIFSGADHNTAYIPYVLDMFKLFEGLK